MLHEEAEHVDLIDCQLVEVVAVLVDALNKTSRPDRGLNFADVIHGWSHTCGSPGLPRSRPETRSAVADTRSAATVRRDTRLPMMVPRSI